MTVGHAADWAALLASLLHPKEACRLSPHAGSACHVMQAFNGDNFVRSTGDSQAWQALNLHSMQVGPLACPCCQALGDTLGAQAAG